MRILYVAPGTKEARVTDDQQRLLRDIGSMAISYLPLVGNVTVDDVVTRLREGTYDVVVFMAHSFGSGIQLSPGEVLEPTMLGSVARYGLKLVVLLACESYGIAQAVSEAANVDVVATILPLESGEAWRTGALLVQALVNGSTNRQAYEQAKPANNRDFTFVAAQQNRLDDRKLTGSDPIHGEKIREHGELLANHEKRLTAIEERGSYRIDKTNVIIGMAFLILVMMIVFAFLASRGGS